MGHVQLEQVEPGLGRGARAEATNWSRTSSMSARVISRGSWLTPGTYGSGDGAISGQLPSGSGSSSPSHISFVEPLRPEWPSWAPIRASPLRVHEVDDPRPRGRVLVRVEAAAAGRDPALARHADHLRHHQAGAADPARAEVDEVEVAGRAVARGVHVHRRDHHAVGELELAQAERREHRRAAGAAERRVDLLDEPGVAQLQLAVGDAPAAREQVEREQHRRLLRRSARSPRTTRGCPGRRAGCSRRSGGGRPRRPRARRARSPGCSRSAQASPIASSSASLVPEPIEKCAVCAASPSSTTFSWCQAALRTVTKLIQREWLPIRRWPSSASANSSSQNAMPAASLSPGASAPVRSSPARRQVSSEVSTMNVLIVLPYG